MEINLTKLGEEYLHFEGSDPAEVFGLADDPGLKATGPLEYRVSMPNTLTTSFVDSIASANSARLLSSCEVAA